MPHSSDTQESTWASDDRRKDVRKMMDLRGLPYPQKAYLIANWIEQQHADGSAEVLLDKGSHLFFRVTLPTATGAYRFVHFDSMDSPHQSILTELAQFKEAEALDFAKLCCLTVADEAFYEHAKRLDVEVLDWLDMFRLLANVPIPPKELSCDECGASLVIARANEEIRMPHWHCGSKAGCGRRKR